MDPLTLSLIKQLIDQLSSLNQQNTQTYELPPGLGETIRRVGMLQDGSNPSREDLRTIAESLNANLTKNGSYSNMRYYCFVPRPFSSRGAKVKNRWRLFGLDINRNVMAIFEDSSIPIFDSNNNPIQYAFIIPVSAN